MGADHLGDVNAQLEMMRQYMFIGIEPAPLSKIACALILLALPHYATHPS